jgi:hypothetical protein
VATVGAGVERLGYVPMLLAAGAALLALSIWFRHRLALHRKEI